MTIRLLIGAPDPESIRLYDSLLESALRLLPLDIVADHAATSEETIQRVAGGAVDLLLLDWALAGGDTPAFLRHLVELSARLRTIIVMPLHLRQYRSCLWQAGACVGLPKEHLDQEWLLSMLCLINRAMEREQRWAREPAR
jgi:DNA-binding NarL/FixJ family response regulator